MTSAPAPAQAPIPTGPRETGSPSPQPSIRQLPANSEVLLDAVPAEEPNSGSVPSPSDKPVDTGGLDDDLLLLENTLQTSNTTVPERRQTVNRYRQARRQVR